MLLSIRCALIFLSAFLALLSWVYLWLKSGDVFQFWPGIIFIALCWLGWKFLNFLFPVPEAIFTSSKAQFFIRKILQCVFLLYGYGLAAIVCFGPFAFLAYQFFANAGIGFSQFINELSTIPDNGLVDLPKPIIILFLLVGGVAIFVGPYWDKFGSKWTRSQLPRTFLANITKPFREIRKDAYYGLGGSARFASVFEEWETPYKPGHIFLGGSVFDPYAKIGHFDDRGMITVASPRSGKGTSAIIPNLLTYPGSILVVDPKGENANETAKYREQFGPVYVLDPFGATSYSKKVALNPLAMLNPEGSEIVDQIRLLAKSMVIRSGEPKSEHFDDGAEDLISALIGHLITEGSDNPNLADLRDLITRVSVGDQDLFHAMSNNHRCGDIISNEAFRFTDTTQEIRNFISNAHKNTKWLDSPQMRAIFSHSEFSIDELKAKRGTTIYLVLPLDKKETHNRFIRLFIDLALRSMLTNKRPELPVLFIIDEFFSLGRMEYLESSSADLPGYGVKLWPILQSVGQLHKLYPANWTTFFSGTGIKQYFAVNDPKTLNYVQEDMGERGFDTAGQRPDRVHTELLSTEEIKKITARETGNQLIIRADGRVFLLRRIPYYQ